MVTRIGGGAVLLIGIALWIFALRVLVGPGGTADGTGLLEGRGSPVPTTTAEVTGATPTAAGTATGTGTETGATTPTAGAGTGSTYTVESGDTMSRIARKLDVSLADLIRANPQIEDPTRIEIGQVLNVPE